MARGDHIKVRRWGGLYAHHGIDMGDGTVIHLDGEPLNVHRARVRRTDMNTFLKGGKLRVVKHQSPSRSGEEAAEAAQYHLSRSGYCLWRNNCEHFATYCRTGRSASRQVIRAVWLGGATAGATCALVVSLVTARRRARGSARQS